MRKTVAGILAGLALGAVTTVSALDMSAGLSGSFTGNFGGAAGDDHSWRTLGGGFNAFFDMTYGEIGVGMTFASRKACYDGDCADDGTSAMFLNLSAMGKYPFALSETMTLFPLVGIDYALGLSAKFDGNDVFANSDYSAVDMSQLWIRFGVGTDIALNEKMFLRPVVQYGIGFAIGDDAVTGGDDANIDHGLTVKVGLGFRF